MSLLCNYGLHFHGQALARIVRNMFQHVLEHQATVYKSKQSSFTTIAKVSAHMNVSADMDHNRNDDERLLNQALDNVE